MFTLVLILVLVKMFGRLGVHAVVGVGVILAVCDAVVVDMSFCFGADAGGSFSVFVCVIC